MIDKYIEKYLAYALLILGVVAILHFGYGMLVWVLEGCPTTPL